MTHSVKRMMVIALMLLASGLFTSGKTVWGERGGQTVSQTFRIRGNGTVKLTDPDGTEHVLDSGEKKLTMETGTYVRLEAEARSETTIAISVVNSDGIELEPSSTETGTTYIREITATQADKIIYITFGAASAKTQARAAVPAAAGASEQFPEKGDKFYGACTVLSVDGGNGHTVHGVRLGNFTGILAGEGSVRAQCAQHSAAAPIAGMKYNYTYTVTSVNKLTGKVQGSIYARSQTQPADGSVDSEGYLIGYQGLSELFAVQRDYNGKLRLRKVSANTGITDGNGCYALKNAVYGVYTDAACTDKAAELRTLADGTADEVELPLGRYYVKELTAPKGYALDKKVYTAEVRADTTIEVRAEDQPQSAPIGLVLQKRDAQTGKNIRQGSASLEDARFEVK